MKLSPIPIKESVVDGPNLPGIEEGVSQTGLFSSVVVLVSFTIVAAMVIIAGWLAIGDRRPG
jgi:hypothetical protein